MELINFGGCLMVILKIHLGPKMKYRHVFFTPTTASLHIDINHLKGRIICQLIS